MAANPVLELSNIGPIDRARVELGDLTVLVGPQASGKSVFLQFLKLVADGDRVRSKLREYGMEWGDEIAPFLDAYCGEGMRGIWAANSSVQWNGSGVPVDTLIGIHPRKDLKPLSDHALLIPAQRVLIFTPDGWIRPFSDFRISDPFSIKFFSDFLRQSLERGSAVGSAVFPNPTLLNPDIRQLLNRHVFHEFQLRLEREAPSKRLVFRSPGRAESLPPSVWSAGQREFVPLLLGLQDLLPARKGRNGRGPSWVMIEELEMGLHPGAISAVLLMVLSLMEAGHRVVLSTHSPIILEFVWAIRILIEEHANPELALRLLDCHAEAALRKLGQSALSKEYRAFYFTGPGNAVKDISDLDPGSEDPAISEWGGLTSMSSRVADIVAEAVR